MSRTIVTRKDVNRAAQLTRQRVDVGVAAGGAPGAPPAGVADTGRAAGGGAAGTSVTPDSYADKLLKYIPADVIAVYLTLQSVIAAAGAEINKNALSWIVFGLLFAATPFWLWRVAGVTKRLQIGLSTAAFAVWVFSLGGPFSTLAWYAPIYGALLLPIVTFAVPIINPDGKHGDAHAHA